MKPTTGLNTGTSTPANEKRRCPCGYRSDPRRACTCSPQVEKYLSRISGPLLDRIDLHVEVPAVPFAQLWRALGVHGFSSTMRSMAEKCS
jgi:magnesium chelatase family protein